MVSLTSSTPTYLDSSYDLQSYRDGRYILENRTSRARASLLESLREHEPKSLGCIEIWLWLGEDGVGLGLFAGNPNDPFSFNKYAYVHGDPIQGTDPTGEFFWLYTLGIGLGLLAGLTALNATGVVKSPSQLPGIGESLIPFWGSGKAYLYHVNRGEYVLAAVNGAFFATDVFLVRSIGSGIAELGWKELIRPGFMKVAWGETWFGFKHMYWQVGDNFYHAWRARTGDWFLRVVSEGTEAAEKLLGNTYWTRNVPVLSTGLARMCGSLEVNCVLATIRAFDRANYGGLERLFKAAMIQLEGAVFDEDS